MQAGVLHIESGRGHSPQSRCRPPERTDPEILSKRRQQVRSSSVGDGCEGLTQIFAAGFENQDEISER